MSGISYSKIVFGLKHQRLYDCDTFIELLYSLCIIISEHDARIDDCERPGLHYHGIIEHGKGKYMDDKNAIDRLTTFCSYFIIEECDNPEKFVVELAQPPKKIMVIKLARSYNLKTYYANISNVGIRIDIGDYEKEVSKMEALKYIINNISARKTFDHVEILKEMKDCYCSTPDQLETLVTHSIELVHQKFLDQSILELCGRFRASENYYTVKESAEIVDQWCRCQNIDVQAFTMNCVNCLDSQVRYKNALYFQGSPDAGVFNIICSIVDACAFIGEIKCESTGFTYVWEKCLEKRCIIMQDPIFDERMFHELENVLSGIGTYVPHRRSTLKYLHPTPVIVICSKNDKNNLYLQRLQTCFLGSYANLKPFMKLSRRLHPDWINVWYMLFTGEKIDNTASCEDTSKRSTDSDSSCEMTENFCPVESISSSAPCAGYSCSRYDS